MTPRHNQQRRNLWTAIAACLGALVLVLSIYSIGYKAGYESGMTVMFQLRGQPMKREAQALEAVLTILASGGVHVAGEGQKYPDEYIHHWGEVYLANPVLRSRGILFATFLAYPEELMQAVVYDGLPKGWNGGLRYKADQEAEIDAQIAILERMLARRRMRVSNGACVEPLHHHAHQRAKRNPRLHDMGAA